MQQRFKFSTLLLFAAFVFSQQVHSVPLHIDFTGSISTGGSFLDPTGNFTQGDALSGYWELETTTPDSDPSADRGAYAQTGSPIFQITIGSFVFEASDIIVQILNDYTAGIGTIDAYDVLASNETSNIAGLTGLNMQLTFRDTAVPLDALSSDALPSDAPDIASFDQIGQVQGQISGYYLGELFFMNLEIDSATASVPEASSIALLAFAILGLIINRRKI